MKELHALIFSGESETLDFKKRITHPDRIARTIASFANTRGGILLVGVMDNGEISGIDPEEEKHVLNQASTLFCSPPVKLFFKEYEEEGKTVLKVIIPESSHKPHLVKITANDWRTYVRVKDETIQKSKIVIKEPALETSEQLLPAFDLQEKILLTFLQRNARITLKQFTRLVNIPQKNAYRILVKMVLLGAIKLHEKQTEKETYYTLS